MNTHSKGLRAQRKVKRYLLLNGFQFVWFIHHTRWSKDIDGLWDGFGIKDNEVFMLQIKSNKKPSMKPFRKWFVRYRIPYYVCVYKDRKGVELFQ